MSCAYGTVISAPRAVTCASKPVESHKQSGDLGGRCGRLRGTTARLSGTTGRLSGATGPLFGAAGRVIGRSSRLGGLPSHLGGLPSRLTKSPSHLGAASRHVGRASGSSSASPSRLRAQSGQLGDTRGRLRRAICGVVGERACSGGSEPSGERGAKSVSSRILTDRTREWSARQRDRGPRLPDP